MNLTLDPARYTLLDEKPRPTASIPLRVGNGYREIFENMNADDIDVLDFDTEWPEVQQLLEEGLAVRAINAGMLGFCREMRANFIPRAKLQTSSDSATDQSAAVDEEPAKAGQAHGHFVERLNGEFHWLAAWNCVIGEALCPELTWHVVRAPRHSTAIGMDTSRAVCADIVLGKAQVSQIRESVRDGVWVPLMDDIHSSEGGGPVLGN